MKNILILGASGMAGHMIYNHLKAQDDLHVVGTTHTNFLDDNCISLNVFDTQKVERILNKLNPDIVINCVGSLIRESKISPDKTIFCNAYFPHFLKGITKNINAKLIHISTDCVFSGNKGSYTEADMKDAADIYGLSKSLGEIEDKDNLTIRTSIIGPELKKNGEGLFHWFMGQSQTVNGYKSSYWSGVTTLELAKFIRWIIDNPITGLVHLTNGKSISKYDLLQKINTIYNKRITIQSNKDYFCDKSLVKSERMDYLVRSYAEMLVEQKDFMIKHREFYAHYLF